LIFSEGGKADIFNKIKDSIDRAVPVLALFDRIYQWVLITGCDETARFIMPDWYEKGGHAFVLGEYTDGDKIAWGRGLKNKTIRRMVADCFAIVRDHDAYMIDDMKKVFALAE